MRIRGDVAWLKAYFESAKYMPKLSHTKNKIHTHTLNIEPEQHDIAIFNNIITPLLPEPACLTGFALTAC